MSDIDLVTSDGVATVRLNAPEHRNALTLNMAQSFLDAIETANHDPNVGAIVVTGGPHFCAGGDRSLLREATTDPAESENFKNTSTLYECFLRLADAQVPTIAAVRGDAVGAGLNLALSAHLRVVSKSARLASGFGRLGLHPGGGHFTLLRAMGGPEAAAAFGLLGQDLSGEEAADRGFVWVALNDEDVENHAHTLALVPGADPELSRKATSSYKLQAHGSGISIEAATALERGTQMWSFTRQRGQSLGRALPRARG